MILSPYFVFIHIPKTGGTWIRTMFDIFSPWEMDVMIRSSYHRNFRDIPPQYSKAPRFTVLRNPWDWYVSMYEYHKQLKLPHYHLPHETWSHQVRNTHQAVSGTFAEALPHFINNMSYHWSRHTQLPAAAQDVTVLRFENLREDLTDFLSRVIPGHIRGSHQYKIFQTRINVSSKENATKRGDYRDYYTEHTRKLVADREKDVIEQMGYSF